jgi:hypothetical protein
VRRSRTAGGVSRSGEVVIVRCDSYGAGDRPAGAAFEWSSRRPGVGGLYRSRGATKKNLPRHRGVAQPRRWLRRSSASSAAECPISAQTSRNGAAETSGAMPGNDGVKPLPATPEHRPPYL